MNRFAQTALSLLFILNIVSGIAHAEQPTLPGADVTAPVMEQKNLVTKIAAGKDHQILVTATDNVAIKNVTLFYRNIGDNMYRNKVMRNAPNTDDYSVTLSASEFHGNGLEYYIQATDNAGNTLLLGYAFSPIAIAVEHPALKEQVASSSVMDSTKPEKKYESEKSNKWLWIGLGILAVGALAASSDDGGGGSGGNSGTSGGASSEPTVVINAPVP
jgi:hypothetical protein